MTQLATDWVDLKPKRRATSDRDLPAAFTACSVKFNDDIYTSRNVRRNNATLSRKNQLRKIEMTAISYLSNLLPMVEELKHPDFARRLNELITKKNMTVTDLSRQTGVTYEMVRRYTIGAAKPRSTVMQKLATALGSTASYLEYGVKDPSERGEDKDMVTPSISKNIFRIEVLDLTVSAGHGVYMPDYVEVLYAIEFTSDYAKSVFGNRAPEDVKVMTVNGDSMAPTLVSGDRLFVDVSVRHFISDGVYSFIFGKTFHIKRLQMQGTRLAVLSDNPAYEKWYITEETQDQFYIIGKPLIHESIKYNRL